MLTKCVILNDKIINIGEWDYDKIEVDGEIVENNPLPLGAITIEKNIEIVNGIIVDLDNELAYKELRKNEYPPIGDQLDAIWNGGTALDEMKNVILAVKDKYPKPTQ